MDYGSHDSLTTVNNIYISYHHRLDDSSAVPLERFHLRHESSQ